jgi:hypothetical protein
MNQLIADTGNDLTAGARTHQADVTATREDELQRAEWATSSQLDFRATDGRG